MFFPNLIMAVYRNHITQEILHAIEVLYVEENEFGSLQRTQILGESNVRSPVRIKKRS